MKEYAFGIDLGGTTAKVGLFTTSGALLEKWEVPTDTSNAGEHILENLADAIHGKMTEKEIAAEQVEGVGIGYDHQEHLGLHEYQDSIGLRFPHTGDQRAEVEQLRWQHI